MQSGVSFRSRINRARNQIALYTIIQCFDPTESRNLGTRWNYRIPLHQRFASWKLEIKQKLIDTILQDYPLGSIIVTSHAEISNGSIQSYYNIQDGQTRLTALHEFANNKFSTFDGRYFRDITDDERARFNNYQIHCDVISRADTTSEREFDEIIADMFERLNSGKPLSDNDKYHARLSTSVMQFIVSLNTSREFGPLLKKYCWAEIGGGKKFTGLKEAAAIVMSVICNDTHCITTSYIQNGKRMVQTDMTPQHVARVYSFLGWYFEIIQRAIQNVAKPKRNTFNKIPSLLGMMLFDWIQHAGSTHDAMWVNFIKATHDHEDFMKTLWGVARLNDGDRRCATTSAFNAKLTATVAAFATTQTFDCIISQITGIPSAATGLATNEDNSDTDTEDEN
jgi:hypothetical protein